MRNNITTLIITMILGLNAVTLSQETISTTLEPISCDDLTRHIGITDDFFAGGVQCAFVTVPENHDNPNGPKIRLATYLIPSTSDNPAADPTFYLEGGPGGPAFLTISDFSVGESVFLRERADVVIIDQRGVGYSEPSLTCLEELSDAPDDEALSTCRERLIANGINLGYYNSHQNALDIQAVRQAYGYKEVNLYGISYGTRLALTIMRDAPEGVRSVVLDSAFPPQVNGLSEDIEVIYYVLDGIVEKCNMSVTCHSNHPNLAKDLQTGIRRLGTHIISDFSAADYLGLLRGRFGDSEITSLIEVVASGSEADIEEFLASMPEEEPDMIAVLKTISEDQQADWMPIADSSGMYNSVICAEEYPFLRVKAFSDGGDNWLSIRDYVKDYVAEDAKTMNDYCQIWAVPKANIREVFAVRSSIPTLVLAGEADTATPPAWSHLAAKGLVNSNYFMFPALGHGVLGMHDCVNEVVKQFISNPIVDVDAGCIKAMPKLDYR